MTEENQKSKVSASVRRSAVEVEFAMAEAKRIIRDSMPSHAPDTYDINTIHRLAMDIMNYK